MNRYETSISNLAYNPEAEHIFNWCRNSAEHNEKLLGLSKYPRTGNFCTAAAGMAFTLATETFRAMWKDRHDAFEPADILAAAVLMLQFSLEDEG